MWEILELGVLLERGDDVDYFVEGVGDVLAALKVVFVYLLVIAGFKGLGVLVIIPLV